MKIEKLSKALMDTVIEKYVLLHDVKAKKKNIRNLNKKKHERRNTKNNSRRKG